MKRINKYRSGISFKKAAPSLVAHLAEEPSILDATPRTLTLSSGGAFATTDKRNFEPNGEYNSHESILPPTDVLDLPSYIHRTHVFMDGLINLGKSKEDIAEKVVKDVVNKTETIADEKSVAERTSATS